MILLCFPKRSVTYEKRRVHFKNRMFLTVSPSLAQGRPFWRYFPWFCLFFWPPSANLHNKGSVGTMKAIDQTREWIQWSRWGTKKTELWHQQQQYQFPIIQNKHSTHQALLVESWWICHWNAELWPRTSLWTPFWNTVKVKCNPSCGVLFTLGLDKPGLHSTTFYL